MFYFKIVGNHGVVGLGDARLVRTRVVRNNLGAKGLIVVAMDNVLCVPLHREGLACARGPVDKDCAVLAIDKGVAKRDTVHVREHFLLRRISVKYFFEGVYFLVRALDRRPNYALANDDLSLAAVYN